MSGIFLEPETTFSISLVPGKRHQFTRKDGGEITLRTATGREFAAITRAIRNDKTEDAYAILPALIVSGIKPEDVGRLHPNAAAELLFAVLEKSRLDEVDSGN